MAHAVSPESPRMTGHASTPDELMVADIGGTRMRVGLAAASGELRDIQVFDCAAYATPLAAFTAYLASVSACPRAACLAVAGPVDGDLVAFTNSRWGFSQVELRTALRLERLLVRNDFEALALALPFLRAEDLHPIGGGAARADSPRLVLGPGTGLGVATLVPHAGAWIALPGEGGHAGFAPQDRIETAIARVLRRTSPRLCNESILSGPGLEAVYRALAVIEGAPPVQRDAAAIGAAALAASDPRALRAVEVFCAVLGSVAGDMALVTGARGGVFVGGGIAPRLLPLLDSGRFRARFEDKALQRAYVAAIPTAVIIAETPALLGALAALRAG